MYPWAELQGDGCIDRIYGCDKIVVKKLCYHWYYYGFMQKYCCNSCAAYYGTYTGIYERMRYSPYIYYQMIQKMLQGQSTGQGMIGQGMMGQGMMTGGMGMVNPMMYGGLSQVPMMIKKKRK